MFKIQTLSPYLSSYT